MKLRFNGMHARNKVYRGAGLPDGVEIVAGQVVEFFDDPKDLPGGRTAGEKARYFLASFPGAFEAADSWAKKVAEALAAPALHAMETPPVIRAAE